MKKITAFILFCAMLLSLCPIAAFAQGESASSDADYKPVIHFDFEGDESLKNKGTLGSAADLTVTTESYLVSDKEAGTVKNTGNVSMYIPKAAVADIIAGGDASVVESGSPVEYTLLVRFKIENYVADTEYRIIEARTFGSNSYRPFAMYYKNGSLGINVSSAKGVNSVSKNLGYAPETLAEYINVAVVVSNTAAEGETAALAMSVYYSAGVPGTSGRWTTFCENSAIKDKATDANAISTVSPINNNMYLTANHDSNGTGIVMDDFRIYDTPMDLASVAAELASSSLDSDFDDYLEIYYDFEGNNYLTNKAYSNTAALADNNTNYKAYHYEDTGVVSGKDSNARRLKLSKTNGNAADFAEHVSGTPVNGYTLFTRFKLEDIASNDAGTGTKYYTIIDYRDTTANTGSRTLAIQYADTVSGNDGILVAISSEEGKAKGNSITVPYSTDKITSDFVNLAIVVSINDEGNYVADAYYSEGIPTSVDAWTHYSKQLTIGAAIAPAPAKDVLFLGSVAGVALDELRLYSTSCELSDIVGIMRGTVGIRGAQTSVSDNSYSIRFLGAVNSLDLDCTGIEITPTMGETVYGTYSDETTSVYSSVLELNTEVTASSRNALYFTVFKITGIPLGENASFKVRFYVTNGDNVYYSEYVTYTVDASGNISAE